MFNVIDYLINKIFEEKMDACKKSKETITKGCNIF